MFELDAISQWRAFSISYGTGEHVFVMKHLPIQVSKRSLEDDFLYSHGEE